MIRATIRTVGQLTVLRLEGHANYAPGGQDIVCAAVSILVSTACNLLPVGRYRSRPGRAVLAFSKERLGERETLRFTAVGLAQLARTYPGHVQVDDMAQALS